MVAVSPNERPHVLLVPVREDKVEVERGFLALPNVEALIHDEEAHAIGQVEQFGGGWIVRYPDGIRSHFAQDFELALCRALVERGAQRPEVMVLVDALDVHVLAVDEQPLA